MRLQWTQDLDVESLAARGHWANMEELSEVVSFHLPRYEQTVKTCQTDPGQVNPSDLTFTTKFLATYLFTKVKGSRPMTYQYLTVEINAKGSKDERRFHRSKNLQDCGKIRIRLCDSDRYKHTNTRRLHTFLEAFYLNPVGLCFGHLKRKPTQQIGQRDEQVGFRRNWQIHSHHALSPTSSKRKVFTRSTTKSIEFCPKTKNIALSLPKCTIRSGDRAKLLSRPTNVFKNYRAPKVRRWIWKWTLDLAAQVLVPKPRLSQPLNVQDQKTRGPKSIPRPIPIAY